MKDYTLTIRFDGGQTQKIPAPAGQSLLSCLRAAGIAEPESPCGGNGTCGKCAARVTGPLASTDGTHRFTAAGETLRLCRFFPAGDGLIELPGKKAMSVLMAQGLSLPSGGDGLGLAADIGTTTVAAYLYDLGSGALLASLGERNAQCSFGADVLSRITACRGDGLLLQRDAIRAQLAELALRLCRASNRETRRITAVAVAGNTVMAHLFDGLDPTGIGVSPFTPVSLFGDFRQASGIFKSFAPECRVYVCPALSGYVGGDVMAGLSACGGGAARGLWLYMDIGTNGEMALGDEGGYLCCATAAGPAFEGAQIECGMPGAPGAIDRVTIENGEPAVHVLGGGAARGLCGSGLVDAAAALCALGAVTPSGRMLPPEEAPASLRYRLRRDESGDVRFDLTENVWLSAQDVRRLQLAKSAVRAGAETLLAQRGKKAADVTALVIAGGFGNFLDVKSALYLGLLPEVPAFCIRQAGNAAGAGAALALTEDGRLAMDALRARCGYLELSASKLFMENYIEQMAFAGEDG